MSLYFYKLSEFINFDTEAINREWMGYVLFLMKTMSDNCGEKIVLPLVDSPPGIRQHYNKYEWITSNNVEPRFIKESGLSWNPQELDERNPQLTIENVQRQLGNLAWTYGDDDEYNNTFLHFTCNNRVNSIKTYGLLTGQMPTINKGGKYKIKKHCKKYSKKYYKKQTKTHKKKHNKKYSKKSRH